MKITFLPMNIEAQVTPGETILQAATRAGVNIDGNCAGMGTCGKCKVKVEGKGYTLACETRATDGMVITVPEAETTAARKKKMIILPPGFKANIPEEDKGFASNYGIALDIGTTTVVAILWNLLTSEMVSVTAVTNPQGAYGADVISRIACVMEDEANLKKLQGAIIDSLNSSIDTFTKENHINPEDIREVVVVGNTTMSHLFMGVDPSSLAVSPFLPVFTAVQEVKAAGLGININPDARVHVAENIAGHVGSDITAGIITTDLMNKDKGHLFIDIGTNGEIVLTGNGKAVTCSTAAGPAFEGSSIAQGMRAARGAIERVDLSDEGVTIKTIGNIAPIGICGSGIIDAVGELIRVGVVDKSGRLLSKERLEKKGLAPALLDRVVDSDGSNDFLLYQGKPGEEDVYITQKDVREVQLAKAAISAGIRIMMNEIGLTDETLEKISIAGAFGNYIRNESAMNVGLLPRISPEKVYSLGNSAGIGASMILLSKDAKAAAARAVEEIEHIELATRSEFQDEYMKAMRF